MAQAMLQFPETAENGLHDLTHADVVAALESKGFRFFVQWTPIALGGGIAAPSTVLAANVASFKDALRLMRMHYSSENAAIEGACSHSILPGTKGGPCPPYVEFSVFATNGSVFLPQLCTLSSDDDVEDHSFPDNLVESFRAAMALADADHAAEIAAYEQRAIDAERCTEADDSPNNPAHFAAGAEKEAGSGIPRLAGTKRPASVVLNKVSIEM